MSHHLVEVRGLDHAYPDGTAALRGVSFTLVHGESLAVVGANGAGKSTLLLHLAGVLLPTAGEVRVGEVPVSRRTLAAVRRAVGLIFQDPDDQLFMPTVREDVGFGPANLGLGPEDVAARVDAALSQVGAAHLAGRPPWKLSQGEKRRAAIAAVLSLAPDVLVMDEPSAGLDPRSRRRLVALLRGFAHTKVVATHDLDLVLDVCERTLVLAEGRVVADGPTRSVLGDAALLAASGLEPPPRLRPCARCGAPAEEA